MTPPRSVTRQLRFTEPALESKPERPPSDTGALVTFAPGGAAEAVTAVEIWESGGSCRPGRIGGGGHERFARQYRSSGEVWSAEAEEHARSTPRAPPLVSARRQTPRGGAAGGAPAESLEPPPDTPSHPLLQSLLVSFSRWIFSGSTPPNMDAQPPPPPPPPPSSSAESEAQ